jgi:hypothetical protein
MSFIAGGILLVGLVLLVMGPLVTLMGVAMGEPPPTSYSNKEVVIISIACLAFALSSIFTLIEISLKVDHSAEILYVVKRDHPEVFEDVIKKQKKEDQEEQFKTGTLSIEEVLEE